MSGQVLDHDIKFLIIDIGAEKHLTEAPEHTYSVRHPFIRISVELYRSRMLLLQFGQLLCL